MPNRILRDWTDSENIDLLSVHAERFFVRLIMKVDDYGRYSANVKLLKSSLFPLKTDLRETDIVRWLAECEKSCLVALYKDGIKEYLMINNFKQTLRQKKEKYPPPNLLSTCYADDTQMLINCSPETKRNEVETKQETINHTQKKIKAFDSSDYYKSGAEAFEEVKNDEMLMEKLTRIVHQAVFRSCNEITIALAVKKFFTVEEAKPEFKYKPKSEIKSHLVNWINKNAKNLTEHARV